MNKVFYCQRESKYTHCKEGQCTECKREVVNMRKSFLKQMTRAGKKDFAKEVLKHYGKK